MKFAEVKFTTYARSIKTALDQIGAAKVLGEQTHILIKPNLLGPQPPPVTTPIACCDAIVDYIRACSRADIVTGEGCGDPDMDTHQVFVDLGYADWALEKGIRLIDLNDAPLEWREEPDCEMFPEIALPEIAFTHYIISVPVLKAHTLSDITGTLKNMMGFAPPRHYSGGRFGCWKKAVFHENLHTAIRDLNRYRTPDLTVMDASVGLAQSHLGGPRCKPPVGKILAGFDPLEIDRRAARLLGLDWMQIGHLRDDEIEEDRND